MGRVVKLPEAEEDLEEIWIHIALENEDAADRVLDELDKECSLRAKRPKMNRLRPDIAPRVRSFPVGSYTVFYYALEDGIEVVQVIHARRDLEKHFRHG